MKIDDIIKAALNEDIGFGDITTSNLHLDSKPLTCFLIAKEKGVLAGLDIAFRTFQMIDLSINCLAYKKDGDIVKSKDEIAKITGPSGSLLLAERVALNFLQRMSGIATLTHKFVSKIENDTKLLDTRKTTPLLRSLEKYAVRVGGGFNHRYGLFDMVMLKENHIRAVGGIKEAVRRIKSNDSSHKIEVEVTDLEELKEAVSCKVDRVMLDNMSLEDMKIAVEMYKDQVELEASGNITLSRIKDVANTGVHFVSTGSVTHSYKSLDISLLFKE